MGSHRFLVHLALERAHSDAFYVSELEAKSCICGFSFLSDCAVIDTTKPLNESPNAQARVSGGVAIECKILWHVVSLATKAKVGAAFETARSAYTLLQALEDMGHTQPPTYMQTKNTTAQRITTRTFSRAMDMKFFWPWDWIKQGHF